MIFWLESRKTLKGGPKETFLRNISQFSPKISLGPPFKVFLDSSQNILWSPPLRFSLKFLKKSSGGGQVLPWSPLWDFFQGGLHPTYTPPWWTMVIIDILTTDLIDGINTKSHMHWWKKLSLYQKDLETIFQWLIYQKWILSTICVQSEVYSRCGSE